MERPAEILMRVQVALREEEGVVIADCPFLNVVTHGQDQAQALAHIREEIELLIEVCGANGTLPDVLKHRFSLGRSISEGMAAHLALVEIALPPDLPTEALRQLADAASPLP